MKNTNRHNENITFLGMDLGLGLIKQLSIGDRVLVEINGVSFLNETDIPICSKHPWHVDINNPPELNETVNEGHILVLSHIAHDKLTLHYKNILNFKNRQPAVFVERSNCLSPNNIYVILQQVSHHAKLDLVRKEFNYEESIFETILKDNDLKQLILSSWAKMFKKFSRYGCRHMSVCRMSMRAYVSPLLIESFQDDDSAVIASTDTKTLLRLHNAIHWLPYLLNQPGNKKEQKHVSQ